MAAYSGHTPIRPLHPFQKDRAKVRLIMGMTSLHESLPFFSGAYRWWSKLGDSAFGVLLGLALAHQFSLMSNHPPWHDLPHSPQTPGFLGYFSLDSHLHKILALSPLLLLKSCLSFKGLPNHYCLMKPLPTVLEKLGWSFVKATTVSGTYLYQNNCQTMFCLFTPSGETQPIIPFPSSPSQCLT